MRKIQKILKELGLADTQQARMELSMKELQRQLHIVAKARDDEYEKICEMYKTYHTVSSQEQDLHETLIRAFQYLKGEIRRREESKRRASRRQYNSEDSVGYLYSRITQKAGIK